MLFVAVLCLGLLFLAKAGGISDEPTFKNVQLKAYSMFTLKFTKTIQSAHSLKDELQPHHGQLIDHLAFTEQIIPVLRKGSISNLEDLDELSIDHCQIKEIQPGAFVNMPLLRRLSLKGNRLENIEEGVFNGLQLSMLDLSKNRIQHIEGGALSDLPNLLNIDLADNLIEAWNQRWFRNVPLLTRVSMQNNSLQTIPTESFINLNGDKKFGSVKLTINLIFSHNHIERIEEGAFEGLGNINNLWLDNNKLTDFGENLLEHVEVQDLRIEHNQINCLNASDLGKVVKAQTTHLDGNPLECPCVEKIKNWAKEHQDKNVDLFYSDMNCVADRLRQKMSALEKRLRDIKDVKEIEETTLKGASQSQGGDEVEVFF